MFGHRYFGARHYGPRYFGDGGAVVVPPVVVVTRPETLGGGGHKKDWKSLKAKELERVLSLLEEQPETAVAVAAIKAQHAKPQKQKKPGQPFVPQEIQVDYAALVADVQAVQWLLDAYQALQEQLAQERLIQAGVYLRLLDDDEDAFMLLM